MPGLVEQLKNLKNDVATRAVKYIQQLEYEAGVAAKAKKDAFLRDYDEGYNQGFEAEVEDD